jgi:ribosomal protein L35AE/L33A
MSDEEFEWIDAIVVGFDEEERILASPTSPIEPSQLTAFIGEEVVYEDYNGNPWRGRIVDSAGDVLVVVFGEQGSSGLPPGLGQGSLLKLPSKPLRK